MGSETDVEGTEDMKGEELLKDGRINVLVIVVGLENWNQTTRGTELDRVDKA